MKNWKRLGAMLLTLVLTLGIVVPTFAAANDTGFSDVPADANYAQAVAWCQEQGLMNGTSATEFSPNAALTRAMVVTVLYRGRRNPPSAVH